MVYFIYYSIEASDSVGSAITLSITADVYDYVFYAIYDTHKYIMTWKNGDGTTLDTTHIVAGTPVINTTEAPYKDDSGLADVNGEPQTYKFTGKWTTEKGTVSTSITNVTTNYTFYPEFIQIGVHEQATKEEFFNITSAGELSPKVVLTGKITIPTTVNDIVVKSIGGFSSSQVTELYFMPDTEVNVISDNCFFKNTKLKKIEPISSLQYIGSMAFGGCSSLLTTD